MNNFGSWPFPVRQLEDMPESLARIVRPFVDDPLQPAQVLSVDSEDDPRISDVDWKRAAGTQVLAIGNEAVVVARCANEGFDPIHGEVRYYALDAWVLQLQLLFGAIEILSANVRRRELRVIFNTVGWRTVRESIMRLEALTLGREQTTAVRGVDLPEVPANFRHYLDAFLPADETIHACYFQPTFRKTLPQRKNLTVLAWAIVHTNRRVLLAYEPMRVVTAPYSICAVNILPQAYEKLDVRASGDEYRLAFGGYDGIANLRIADGQVANVAQLLQTIKLAG